MENLSKNYVASPLVKFKFSIEIGELKGIDDVLNQKIYQIKDKVSVKYFILLFLILVGCNQQSPKTSQNQQQPVVVDSINSSIQPEENGIKTEIGFSIDSLLEERIIDKICKIKEVKAIDRRIDSVTNGKQGITIILQGEPTGLPNYYWVQAGYTNSIRFIPYLNFYVKKKTLDIYFLDTVRDEILTLKEWRNPKRPTTSKSILE